MAFLFSKLLHFLTIPAFWVGLLWVLALWIRRENWRKRLKVSALVVTVFFTNNFIFKEFVRLWEYHGVRASEMPEARVGVVLGGMTEFNNDLDRLSLRRGSDRIWQAMELYQLGKIEYILISGDEGYVTDRGLNEAMRLREELVVRGIPRDAILVDSLSKTTYENAVQSAKIIREKFGNTKDVVLITSSVHMRRSLACFERQGIQALPYATDQYTGPKRHYHWDEYVIPYYSTLVDWQALTHEWIGMCWYKLMGYA
jgi:uncharacterized SAM-binding protein YcdF (DUF218 family)